MRKIFVILMIHLFTSNVYAQSDTSFEPLNIGLTTQIYSTSLKETRRINIYLPEDYNANDTTSYPVIYILDGGIHEDFFHLVGIVQYYTQPWINLFPKSIVIGIENTNRRRDFTFSVPNLDFLKKTGYKKEDIPDYGGSAAYISFLEKELQPFINGHFRTNKNNTVIGESLAGLLVTEIYANHRGLFENYIIISPSLWWGNEKLLKEIEPDKNEKNINVYVGAPGKNEDTLMYNDALKLYNVLKQTANSHTKVYYDYLPRETHATVIHQAAYNAFRLFYKK